MRSVNMHASMCIDSLSSHDYRSEHATGRSSHVRVDPINSESDKRSFLTLTAYRDRSAQYRQVWRVKSRPKIKAPSRDRASELWDFDRTCSTLQRS